MASPSVVNSATTDGSTGTTSPVLNLPASIVGGRTLIALFRCAGVGEITWPGGWTEIYDGSPDDSNDVMSVAWRLADGTEGSTITLSKPNPQKFTAIIWQISGATDPTVTPPELSTVAIGDSATPDPTTVTPTGGSKDYLFLWLGGWGGKQSSPPAGNPTNYSGPVGSSSGTEGLVGQNCRVAGAYRQLTASSEDPGSWTISYGFKWTAWTMAVHPPPLVVGEVTGKGEAIAAVAGTGEAIAAVAGTGEAIAAVAGQAQVLK